MSGELGLRPQVFQLGLRLDALREVATLGRQNMSNDLVAGAAAAPDTRTELRRDAGGRLVELGPRRAQQPHLAIEGRRVERLAVERRGRERERSLAHRTGGSRPAAVFNALTASPRSAAPRCPRSCRCPPASSPANR